MMSVRLLLPMAVIVGTISGYAGYPLLHQRAVPQSSSVINESYNPGTSARGATACEFSAEQIDHLAARLAPTVVERLATSGLNGVRPDPKVAAQQHELLEKSKTEQAQAFTRATEMIDQMIANRHVTQEGISTAHKLLQQTNQSGRGYELTARIAAAVNKGDLTPIQAGHVPAGVSSNY